MTLREATEILRESGIESPQIDARLLFEAFSSLDKKELYLKGSADESEQLINAVRRRAKREPLQHIIGKVGFYREEYIVSPNALIPRADTEHLVDYAVRHLPRGARFLDICTGSGCIAISTLANTEDTTAVALDISAPALKLAKKNASVNGVADRLELLSADILNDGESLYGSYDAVLSNPPYIAEDVYVGLAPEIFAEPRIAFVGGEDGLVFYRAIVPTAKRLITDEGFIALEIGYDQAEALKLIAEENDLSAEIIKDWSGNDRVIVLRKR